MLIVCPNCAISYQIEAASLGPDGRAVRCVRCRHVWHATPQPELALAAADTDGEDLTADRPAFAETSFSPDDALPRLEDIPDRPEADEIPEESPDNRQRPDHLVIDDAPPISPAEPEIIALHEIPDARYDSRADIESMAARLESRRSKRRRPLKPALIGLAAALVALNAGLVVGRAEVVRAVPQAAPVYAFLGLPVNLRGLVFSGVKTTADTQDGVSVLAVEGVIENKSGKPAEVPRLRFAVRNDSGHEIYAWTSQPAQTVIPAGETMPFRSRLASPPSEGREILVRFLNRRDLAGANP